MTKAARDDVAALYERHADAWIAARRDTGAERPWLDRFDAALPRRPARVLDLGCGHGRPVGADLIGRGHRLTGLDAAPSLLAAARAVFPDHDWRLGDLRAPPALGRFDGIVAWHSLFHLAAGDQRTVLSRLTDLTAPRAALLFTSGPDASIRLGTFAGDPLYHASLAPEDYRACLAAAGFEVTDHVPEDPTCGGATVWLARLNAAPRREA